MTDLHQYPAGTILSQMHVEMYASTVRDQVTILHDKPFEKALDFIEFINDEQDLIFVYEDGERVHFGGYVDEVLVPHLNKVTEIGLFLINKKKKAPTDGVIVPLKIY